MLPRLAWVAAAVAGALLLVMWPLALGPRLAAERDHQNCALLLDYQQLLTLSQDQGIPLEEWLGELRTEGFDHLALMEDTPLWMQQRGFCVVAQGFSVTKSVPEDDRHVEGSQPVLQTPEEIASEKAKDRPIIDRAPATNGVMALLDLDPNDLHLLFPIEGGTEGNLYARITAENAALRLGRERVALSVHPEYGQVAVSLKGDPEELVDLGLGFVTPTARRLTQAGFAVVPRLRNQRSLTEEGAISRIVAEAARAVVPNARLMIGAGDETLGYPKALDETAAALRAEGLLFGYVEFAKQTGDKALADKLVPAIVRVHSISDEEMEIYTPERATERYLLAARERNVRAIYLKPFFRDQQGVDLRAYNTAYFKAVRDGLVDLDLNLSTVSGGPVSNALAPWPVATPVMPPSKLLVLLALAVAVLLPLIALWLLTDSLPALFAAADRGDQWGAMACALAWLWGWGLLAALIQAALGSTPHYMLQTRSFSGVQLALLGPVLLAGILWVRVLVENPPRSLTRQAVLLGSFPIHVKHLAIGGIVLLAALIVVIRSGNEPVGGVSPMELALRSLLGQTLDVRPRTKEFLIGHPSLVLGLYLLFQRQVAARPFAYPFLVGGMLGITSFINTFQHFHTPLAISFKRTFLGMGLGFALGVGLVLIAAVILRLAFGRPPDEHGQPLEESP